MSDCKLIYEIEYTGWAGKIVDKLGKGDLIGAGMILLANLQAGPQICFSAKIKMKECEGECSEGEVGCELPWSQDSFKDRCVELGTIPSLKNYPDCIIAIDKLTKLKGMDRIIAAGDLVNNKDCKALADKLTVPANAEKALEELQKILDDIVDEEVGPKVCKCGPVSENMLRPDAVDVIIQNALDKKNKRSVGG